MTLIGTKTQRGFALTSVMIAIMISTLLAVYASIKVVDRLNSAAAEATGTYMMNVRGALLKTLSEHAHAYQRVDISAAPVGTYPDTPSWASFTGNTHDISIRELKERYVVVDRHGVSSFTSLLPDAFPDTPPLGRSVHVRFVRTGTCPGDDCNVDAYVYTCWPIRSGRPAGVVDPDNCPNPPAQWEASSNLVGDVMMATEGYGSTNMLDPAYYRGPLFKGNSADLSLPADTPGIVAVLASLKHTMHDQFVRVGDDRPIHLKNNLTVDGFVQSNTGMLISTNYSVGASCEVEGMYGTSNRQSLVQCKGGQWFEIANHMITQHQQLPHNAIATAPVCPGPNLEPFYIATLSSHDSRMSGTSIGVSGTLSGEVDVTGQVYESGSVDGSGSISGTFASNNASFIRTTQAVDINSNTRRVTISGISGISGANARALVISGCKTI